MSQSSIIAGALLAAFIFWLAINNRLEAYTAVLWGKTAAPTPTGTPTIAVKNESSGGGGGGFLGLPSPFGGSSGGSLSNFLDSLNLSDPASIPADAALVAGG